MEKIKRKGKVAAAGVMKMRREKAELGFYIRGNLENYNYAPNLSC